MDIENDKIEEEEIKITDLIKTDNNESVNKVLNSSDENTCGLMSIKTTRCKLCNSELKEKAEQMYSEGQSISSIKTWLENNGLLIANPNIKHHLVEHFKSEDRKLLLLDYCLKLSEQIKEKRSRRDDLDMLVNVCRLELSRIVSLPTNNSINLEKERNSMMVSIIKSMKDAIESINSMEDSEAKAKSVENKFLSVWKELISNAPQDQKRAYVTALQKFKKSFDDVQVK